MPIAKPSGHIDWTPSEPVGVATDPGPAKKAAGWLASEKPPFDYFNWLFARLGNWQLYFESATDELLGVSGQYAAVVAASGGTHTDLQSAHDAVAAGSRILVIDGETIDTRISISKANIEIDCLPGVTYTKGTETVGLEISGLACRLSGARFLSFTTGGDIAINFLAGGEYGVVEKMRFAAGTDTMVDDSAVAAGRKPFVVTSFEES